MVDFSQYATNIVEQPRTITPQIYTNESIVSNYYVTLKTDWANLPTYVAVNIYHLLDLAIEEKNQKALEVLNHEMFLDTTYNLIKTGTLVFADEYIHRFNRVCYDFLRLQDHNLNIASKMLNIAFEMNKAIVLTLMGFGLTQEQSCMVAIARYSTAADIRVNYKRVVRVIQSFPAAVMTEQTICDIFSKTCTESVSDLFTAIIEDPYTEFRTKDSEYVYSTVSLAILDVIESALSTSGIDKVLSTYIEDLKDKQSKSDRPVRTRFMLKSVNLGDYPRFNQSIDRLEAQGYYIP